MEGGQARARGGGGSFSEGQVVVGVGPLGVRSGLPVTADDVVEVTSAAQESLGELRDGVAVVMHAAVLVAEQMGILGEQGEADDVQGVVEQIDGGELRGAQQIDGRQRGRSRRQGLHRFLTAARLAAGAGAWNTSK
jgi:hypothetical protein